MVSKGDLGVGYLVAVGIALFGALTSGLLLPGDSAGIAMTPDAVLAILTASTVAAGFTVSGIGLANSELSGERIWRVALWGTVGLGVPTVLIVLLAGFFREALAGLGWPSVAMVNVAGGGVVGILVGTITELKAEHDRTIALNQRNTVFLRLFRHDIRNSVTAALGHLDLIADDPSSADRSIEIVQRRIDRIAELSEAARQLDELESHSTTEPVDLLALVRDRLEDLRRTYPAVEFETDLPSEATVAANDLLASVLDNVLLNAIEHNDGEPEVRVTIARDEPSVELRIEDDGPGFSENELSVHADANETAMRHSDGIGLWLARWIVDSYGGDLSIGNAETGGAVVTVELPLA